MGFDFVVIGATGQQGRICSRDLLESKHSVLLCGRDKERVRHMLKRFRKAKFEYLDLRKTDVTKRVIRKSGSSVVINCAEGDWNLDVLKVCSSMGVNSIDLGSEIPMTKEQLGMNDLLKKKGIAQRPANSKRIQRKRRLVG